MLDGDEPNPSRHGRRRPPNIADADSDNDGLFDGTELGLDCSNAATDQTAGRCVPDGDIGATTTSPLDADTDDGGVTDGSEDSNLNGVVDPMARRIRTTPATTAPSSTPTATGSAMISKARSDRIRTTPTATTTAWSTGRSRTRVTTRTATASRTSLDPDSDNDGLPDGLELGLDCSNPATDPAANACEADADMGATKTSPIEADTDNGGLADGVEDTNGNGVVDGGETDPNDPSDDVECNTDADCGGPTSGIVCDESNTCVQGCRGEGGNGCPTGLECSSMDDSIGTCSEPMTSGTGGAGGAGGGGTGGAGTDDSGVTLAGGCAGCTVASDDDASRGLLAALGVALLAFGRRRRRA